MILENVTTRNTTYGSLAVFFFVSTTRVQEKTKYSDWRAHYFNEVLSRLLHEQV